MDNIFLVWKVSHRKWGPRFFFRSTLQFRRKGFPCFDLLCCSLALSLINSHPFLNRIEMFSVTHSQECCEDQVSKYTLKLSEQDQAKSKC